MEKTEQFHYNTPYSAKEKEKALNLLRNSTIEFVAHRYHCTERTLYRWKSLYDGTLQSLENHSKRPKTVHPNAHTKQEIKHIKDLIHRNPNIGLNELYGKLRRFYAYQRSYVGLYRFLRKNGYFFDKPKRVKRVSKPYDTPQSLGIKMQIDVKVVPKDCYSGIYSDEKFYQYTAIDESSRERFVYAYKEQCQQSSVDFLKRVIVYFRYKPLIVQTDNGQEFTYTRQASSDKEHLFDRACRLLGIEHKRIKPRTPRHNGKVERSHRNDNERFYKYLKFYSYEDLLKQMSAYLKRSNDIPSSVLCTRDKKEKWLTPLEKRAELLLLDYNIKEDR
ncbi:MAG: DDE-type integrase/transposase/recombinase [Clostridiales bacterium]|jgi:transposase InsO family protein|nr:DDE-type integrase/transposase/recombinase [Clostridiales bacterium]